MKAYSHQTRIADESYKVLKAYGLIYLSMEERTGKTLTSILVCEMSKAKNILIITKKKALTGWEETLQAYPVTKKYTAINYEAVHNLEKQPFDLVILDEAHANLSAYPKLGERAKKIREITYNLPIIFLSATPSAQTYAQLFHQFAMTKYSPFAKYKTFYRWFDDYGIAETMFIHGRQVKKYSTTKDFMAEISHLFISYTRKELGFQYEPNDIIHFVEMSDTKKQTLALLLKKEILEEFDYVADSPMKLMTGLHQLEGSTLKCETKNIFFDEMEKVDYILENWGDTEDIVIFYHYKAEEILLNKRFKKASILQATSFAEGVDLHKYKTLIIYSMDFSTARYSQRRARQCNMKRDEDINVHYLLVKKGISESVYTTVAINKKNFINSYFKIEDLNYE